MRTSVSMKLIVLPCVAYLTWLVTAPLMAQRPHEESAPLAANGSKERVSEIPDYPAADRADTDMIPISQNTLREFTLEVQGNFVRAHASVSMMSRLRGPFHFWRLKVIDLTTDAVVSDVPYIEQRFQMHESGSMNPTFDEIFQLPTGKYRVFLALYKIPDGMEVEEILNDKHKAAAATIISGPKTVQIP